MWPKQLGATACTISHAWECRPLKSYLDWCFSFSVMAFKNIATVQNMWNVKISSDGQHILDLENLPQV